MIAFLQTAAETQFESFRCGRILGDVECNGDGIFVNGEMIEAVKVPPAHSPSMNVVNLETGEIVRLHSCIEPPAWIHDVMICQLKAAQFKEAKRRKS